LATWWVDTASSSLQERSILIHFGWTNHNFVLHQPCEEYDGDNIT
jgi:hypothetical protein